MALGLVVMLVSVSTGVGLQRQIRQNVAAFAGHIQILPLTPDASPGIPYTSIQQSFYPQYASVSEVSHIQAYATQAGLIKKGDEFEGVALKGIGSDYRTGHLASFLKSGQIPRFGIGEASDSILLSQNTADALRIAPGERIKMYFVRDSGRPILRYFTVAGTFKSGISEFDDNYAIGDIRSVQSINRWDSTRVSGFEVILHDPGNIYEAYAKIQTELLHTFHVTHIARQHAALLEWVSMFDINIVVILSIMILVCGVNMITVLLILILEKTSFIGLMKSLGASNGMLRRVFLWNAFYIIVRGLFWGNLIGITILLAQKYFGIVTLDSQSYSIEVVPVYLSIGMILALNIGTALLNMLMLLIPSYFISRINPAETVKYE